uniref:Homeobox domain-containing protein n=1 Tax=Opuntia streptacantha TaxID=393608 RepID=A0A7C9A8F2_OPUST
MEELSEVQYEENKELPEKNKRRRFKTPFQLQSLEEFYNEHKYPTESMKAELAEKLGLTEKQVSGWFCHRRLKDKRLLKDESNTPGRQDLSGGVVQDRGSGLKQDSCSSTKPGDYMVADLREVESRRFCRSDLGPAEVNYEARELCDGTEMDDTSSESSSDLQESFNPKNRNPLDMETAKYRAPNGFIAKDRGRVGPSGYLKIKGQTENAAITAVKRQLGRLYREDGPSLGIEFDPLPPRAFESPSKNTNNEAYRIHEPTASGSGLRKRPGLSTRRNQDVYAEAADYRPFHKSDQDALLRHQSKQKQSFPNQSHVFPGQKSSFGVDSYSAREISESDADINHIVQRKRGLSGMKPDPFSEHQPQPHGGKGTHEAEEPLSLSYDNVNPKIARRRDSNAAPLTVRPKDPINVEGRVPPSRIKDEEVSMERRPIKDHHESIRLKKRQTNEFRASKRGREEFLQEDYAIKTSSQELPQWSRQMKVNAIKF